VLKVLCADGAGVLKVLKVLKVLEVLKVPGTN